MRQDPHTAPLHAAGDHIDRFVVLGSLGAGAMGMVLAAHDPELDRRIAIKLVHPERSHDARAKERLLREARAGAQLSHPNVVSVYEVGTVGDDVFIAFEYVDGTTLREWLATNRSVREILDVFVQAGRGLRAAHEAGVVHRDFKPDNVLIGHDGRVRVADFGLAGVEVARVSAQLSESGRVTHTGALVGTPAYMAPEQWMASWDASDFVDAVADTRDGSDGTRRERMRLDARSDQFGFCVALFEALYGRRPFAGQTVFALQNAVLHDAPRFPSQPSLPARLKRALGRGLAKDPEQRFASMAELLAALEPRRNSRSVLLALGATMLSLLAVGFGVWSVSRPPCAEAAAAFDEVWNEPTRTALGAHLTATGGAAGAEVAARTLRALSTYAATWREARSATCRATHDQHVQSAALLDVRMQCLDDRARDFAALVRATRAESNTGDAALAVTRLPSPAPCRAMRFGGDLAAAHTGREPQLEAVRATISEARAQLALAKYPRASELAAKARDDAKKYALPALEIDAVIEQATALRRLAQHDALETLLKETRQVAARLGDPMRLAALLDRVVDLNLQRGMLDTAELMLEEYRLQSVVAGEPPHLSYGYQYLAGRVHQQRGALARSYEAYRKARELGLAYYPRDIGRLAILTEGCGIAAQQLGRLDEARALLEDAVARGMEAFGEHHPVPSLTRLNLGIVYKQQGHYELAERAYLASLRVFEAAHPGAHPDTASLHNNLGSLALDQGHYDRAMPHLEKAAAMRVQLFGADSATLINSHANLGIARLGQRRYDEAERELTRSVELTRLKLGEDHPKRASAESGLARLAIVRGDLEAALAHFEQEGRVTELASGKEHAQMVEAHAGAAYALALLGRCAEAVPRARRALEIVRLSTDRELAPRAHFSLARCLSGSESRTHAEQALTLLHAEPALLRTSEPAQLLERQLEARLKAPTP